MTAIAKEYFDKINELFVLYEKVKLAIIYAENFDPKQELYIAPINQLRSSLDHIFKAAAHHSDMEYELKEAKEHLDRAGFDAFEIFASNLGIVIVEQLNVYSTDTLSFVFPEYYHTIKPKLTEIKAKLGEIRKRKKDSIKGSDDSFSSYSDQIEILLGFSKSVDCIIPSLEEYHQKKLKEKEEERKRLAKERFKKKFFNFIYLLIICVVGGFIVYHITKPVEQSKITTSTQIEQKINK